MNGDFEKPEHEHIEGQELERENNPESIPTPVESAERAKLSGDARIEALRKELQKTVAKTEETSNEPAEQTSGTLFETPNLSRTKNTTDKIKQFGSKIGKSLGWIKESLENRVNTFDIETLGAENLAALKDKPYILVANHIKPNSMAMQALGASPDAFVLKKIAREVSNAEANVVSNVSGKISKFPLLKYIDRVWSPLRAGVMEGMGFITIKTKKAGKEGGFNRDFILKAREAIGNNQPIIIFPQGGWTKDFNPDLVFETGSATLAKNYDVPIIPVFIEGEGVWRNGTKYRVKIGEGIVAAGRDKNVITSEIKERLLALQGELGQRDKHDQAEPQPPIQ